MNIFLATLNPMLTLFLCIAVGFALCKCKILPEGASAVIAKLETWVFCPALSFMTMLRFCTLSTIREHAVNVLLGALAILLSVAIAIPLSCAFVRKKSSERGIYRYALAVANSGYLGDPVVLSLFGDVALSYYKLYCLPLNIVIYTWGMSVLVPDGNQKSNVFKKVLNPPTVAMLLGVAAGLLGLEAYLPTFLLSSLDSLKACMGPGAMLLAGITIARFDLFEMLKNKKVYVATALRLFVLPILMVAFLFGLKELANALFSLEIGNNVLYLGFFASATALGLNTIVFPEAYGGDPRTGASMALISHTLCVISIPLLYTLLHSVFGPFVIG
ncbi:MAG: AEC family transporter [Clostridia bacterium]|nr:AEC family transporter [Clostridia bacterium]